MKVIVLPSGSRIGDNKTLLGLERPVASPEMGVMRRLRGLSVAPARIGGIWQ